MMSSSVSSPTISPYSSTTNPMRWRFLLEEGELQKHVRSGRDIVGGLHLLEQRRPSNSPPPMLRRTGAAAGFPGLVKRSVADRKPAVVTGRHLRADLVPAKVDVKNLDLAARRRDVLDHDVVEIEEAGENAAVFERHQLRGFQHKAAQFPRESRTVSADGFGERRSRCSSALAKRLMNQTSG